jgi:hypothetical protein
MRKSGGYDKENLKRIDEIIQSGKSEDEIDGALVSMYLDGGFKGSKERKEKTYKAFMEKYPGQKRFPSFKYLLCSKEGIDLK